MFYEAISFKQQLAWETTLLVNKSSWNKRYDGKPIFDESSSKINENLRIARTRRNRWIEEYGDVRRKKWIELYGNDTHYV